ncbi:MAG: CBS domain-containing protein [Treponema sp.]|jgi:CBS domain-containing protein/anti-sigma regulatory factor (Ser/Thr protein kinase)|nr:CBS domain-containing protein [Treponema sp.]
MSDDNVQQKEVPISTVDSPSVVLELIYQLKIKDVMTSSVITAKPSQSLRHVQALMRENRITGVPIAEELKLVGMISIDDIVIALDKGLIDCPIEERMTRDVIVLQDDMPLSFAISYLNKYNYGRFPVLNKNHELVGVLSPTDVIKSLLVEMNREVLRLEKMQKESSSISSPHSEMEYNVPRYDFELAGRASTEIKKALKQRNIDPKIIRRIAIASYELEINLVVHSQGGTIHCRIQPDKIMITATDVGPGIADVNQALQEGWSTANEYVRSLGFGAGMGLANTKRVSDEFSINSALGVGTTVRSVVYVNSSKDET